MTKAVLYLTKLTPEELIIFELQCHRHTLQLYLTGSPIPYIIAPASSHGWRPPTRHLTMVTLRLHDWHPRLLRLVPRPYLNRCVAVHFNVNPSLTT